MRRSIGDRIQNPLNGTPAARLPVRLAGLAGLAGLVAAACAGCQHYTPLPLDLAGHRSAFLARTPESPEVRAFAESLAAHWAEGGGAASEFDPFDGVSCAEAEAIAMVFNTDLRLARLRAGVTRATAENAGQWEDPSLGVDLARIIQGTPEPWKVFTSVGVTIPISGRLEIEKQRAGAEHAAELARVAQREWSVRMSVRREWAEWSASAAQFAATREFLERVGRVLDVVDTMERVGEMARSEARLFRIERASRAADLGVLGSRVRESELRLRQLMGMSPDAPIGFRAGAVGPARSGAAPPAEVDELEQRSPALLVAIAEYQAAEKALELEIRQQYPDLHIGPGYGREDGQDQVLLGLSLPVPILNANRRGIAEASARRELARAAAQGVLEQTIAELRAAESRLAAAGARRRALESELVPLVDAQYRDAREAARLGEVNTLVLLESLTRQHAAKIGLVEAARDEAVAAVDVDELLGPDPRPRPPEPTPTDSAAIPAPSARPGRAAPPEPAGAPGP